MHTHAHTHTHTHTNTHARTHTHRHTHTLHLNVAQQRQCTHTHSLTHTHTLHLNVAQQRQCTHTQHTHTLHLDVAQQRQCTHTHTHFTSMWHSSGSAHSDRTTPQAPSRPTASNGCIRYLARNFSSSMNCKSARTCGLSATAAYNTWPGILQV